ncbi:protein of unknown function [Methylocella tundrae]|uniref:Uncharacterized protein n=1 Tax=Methylocella tundrae TaxID=227605 RepID=A0A4V6YUH5_METTU|nr:protein of unknown function [Methylocella tundrae]
MQNAEGNYLSAFEPHNLVAVPCFTSVPVMHLISPMSSLN